MSNPESPNHVLSDRSTNIKLMIERWDFICRSAGLSPQHIIGWDVLDLGCGSKVFGKDEEYAPWFPRVCANHYGMKVTGIDLGDSYPKDKDVYEHIKTDLVGLLVRNRLVEFLNGRQFNLIHTDRVFLTDNPDQSLQETIYKAASNYHLPKHSYDFYDLVNCLMNNLKQQSLILLKPDGILAINEYVYVLENGQLKKVS